MRCLPGWYRMRCGRSSNRCCPDSGRGGRAAIDDRAVFTAIVYVLTSGCAWRHLPPSYLHHAVDDHSRLAYSEILDDERKGTAAGFWTRARSFFTDHRITVTRVLTDNGACYRSKDRHRP